MEQAQPGRVARSFSLDGSGGAAVYRHSALPIQQEAHGPGTGQGTPAPETGAPAACGLGHLRGPAGPGHSAQQPRSGFVGHFSARLPEGFPSLSPYSDLVTCPLRHQTRTLLALWPTAVPPSPRSEPVPGPLCEILSSQAGSWELPRPFKSSSPWRGQPGLLCLA